MTRTEAAGKPVGYIDESGFATDMPRTHGGSLKGLRSYGKHDWRQDSPDAIRGEGHICEYLPVYSPDLNPIEHPWAQVKALRRKHRCCVATLFRQHVI